MRDISLHLSDIICNSKSAGAANIEVSIIADYGMDLLTITIIDDGSGMDCDFTQKVLDPFVTTRTTRKVGLGLPLFKEACEISGGTLLISSSPGSGTTVIATLGISNIDRIPLGDIGEAYFILALESSGVNYALSLSGNEKRFDIDIAKYFRELTCDGHNAFSAANVIKLIIEKKIIEIFGGILDEIP